MLYYSRSVAVFINQFNMIKYSKLVEIMMSKFDML